MTKTTIALLCLCLSMSAVATDAQAGPIRYTLSAIGSGSLGGTPFSLVPFTITATAESSQISNPFIGFYKVPTTNATVAVSGFSTATFTLATNLFLNSDPSQIPTPAVGISAIAGFDILDVVSSSLAGYQLDAPKGPITGPALFNKSSTTGDFFATTSGNFGLEAVSTATFQATNIPEPSTAALLVIGCVVALVAHRSFAAN